MRFFRQLCIILGFSVAGEALRALIPLPVPASIYGLLLLLAALKSHLLSLESVEEAGSFLLEVMPLMFVPAGVGLLSAWDVFQRNLIPALAIIFISLVTVFWVTGRLAQALNRRSEARHG